MYLFGCGSWTFYYQKVSGDRPSSNENLRRNGRLSENRRWTFIRPKNLGNSLLCPQTENRAYRKFGSNENRRSTRTYAENTSCQTLLSEFVSWEKVETKMSALCFRYLFCLLYLLVSILDPRHTWLFSWLLVTKKTTRLFVNFVGFSITDRPKSATLLWSDQSDCLHNGVLTAVLRHYCNYWGTSHWPQCQSAQGRLGTSQPE